MRTKWTSSVLPYTHLNSVGLQIHHLSENPDVTIAEHVLGRREREDIFANSKDRDRGAFDQLAPEVGLCCL